MIQGIGSDHTLYKMCTMFFKIDDYLMSVSYNLIMTVRWASHWLSCLVWTLFNIFLLLLYFTWIPPKTEFYKAVFWQKTSQIISLNIKFRDHLSKSASCQIYKLDLKIILIQSNCWESLTQRLTLNWEKTSVDLLLALVLNPRGTHTQGLSEAESLHQPPLNDRDVTVYNRL